MGAVMNDNLILLSDDDHSIRLVTSKALAKAGYVVKMAETLSGLMDLIDHHHARVLITDVVYPDGDALGILPEIKQMRPDLKIIMMSARSTLLTAVKAQESEVFAYIPKPFALDQMVDTVADALNVAKNDEDAVSDIARSDDEQTQLIGRSPAMQDIFRTMARLVSTDLSVMITGESGTGKEVVARALHDLGNRKDRPFVALNMAAIPRELIESELFGHEKGAFTGADRRTDGRFAQAKEGTLFLDEIGDMPPDAQIRLLRVLQDGGYTRVGGRDVVLSDARIIAATHQHLPELISKGLFREDLYYRLNVVPLNLPPLRDRPDDIADLVQRFLVRGVQNGLPMKTVSDDGVNYLEGYRWPGNVRELENLVKRLLVLVDEDIITSREIALVLKSSSSERMISSDPTSMAEHDNLADVAAFHLDQFFKAHHGDLPSPGLYSRIMAEIERPLIEKTLTATGGNQIKAAEVLGLNRNTLRKKIQTFGISIMSARMSRYR